MAYLFKGTFYLAGSSLSVEVDAEADEHGRVSFRVEEDFFSYVKGEYDIQSRLGSTRRVVLFFEGARFETDHSRDFESFEKAVQTSRWPGVVDWLERRWMAVLSCVAAVALISFCFLYWGVPALAWIVAKEVPQELREQISEQSLDTMKSFGQLKESKLEKEDFERTQRAFARAIELAGLEGSEFSYELLNFGMNGVPNAFALPSGKIVATDSFARLCETDDQLVAVFLHEIAHVEEQHGIRSLVQRTGVVVIASMVLGDISAVANVTGALPVLLLESQYSQRFEMESDTFAAETLEASGLDSNALEEILILLHNGERGVRSAAVLSSHPSLQERIDNLDRIQSSEE